jgi:hypothetical protein
MANQNDPQAEGPREMRDKDGRVLCGHGRPMECLECGEEYAAGLNKAAPSRPQEDTPQGEQAVGRAQRLAKFRADYFSTPPTEISQLAADAMIVVIDLEAQLREALPPARSTHPQEPVVIVGSCRNGDPHYCPNCDNTFTALCPEPSAARSAPEAQAPGAVATDAHDPFIVP